MIRGSPARIARNITEKDPAINKVDISVGDAGSSFIGAGTRNIDPHVIYPDNGA